MATQTSLRERQAVKTADGHTQEPVAIAKSKPASIAKQAYRALSILTAFIIVATSLHVQQLLAVPLFYINRKLYYSWQAFVKQSAGLFIFAINYAAAPAKVKVSYDAGLEGQIKMQNGRLKLDFPDRMVLISNHILFTDWIYFWWIAYSSGNHGDIFIILKESVRLIPVIGPLLTFFSFIWMSRKWETDEKRLSHRLDHLAQEHAGMWLLLFPEGTNMDARSLASSKKWSAKHNIPELDLCLVPRTRGLQICLQRLRKSVDWLYDCTIVYDGVPAGEFGEDVHSLKGMFVDGAPAPLMHQYWRRYAIKDIPLDDDGLTKWLNERWLEKESMLQYHQRNGEFPESNGHITTEVKIGSSLELAQISLGFVSVALVWFIGRSLLGVVLTVLGR